MTKQPKIIQISSQYDDDNEDMWVYGIDENGNLWESNLFKNDSKWYLRVSNDKERERWSE